MIFIPYFFLIGAIIVMLLWMRSTKNKYRMTYFISGSVLVLAISYLLWVWVTNTTYTIHTSPGEAFQKEYDQDPTEVVYGENSALAFLDETTYEIYEKSNQGWYQKNSFIEINSNQVFFEKEKDFFIDIIKSKDSKDVYVTINQYREDPEELLPMEILDNYDSTFTSSPLIEIKNTNQAMVYQRFTATFTYKGDLYAITINGKRYNFDLSNGGIRFIPVQTRL